MADDKQQMQQTIDGYTNQIQDLQKRADGASGDDKQNLLGQINELNTKKQNTLQDFQSKYGDFDQYNNEAQQGANTASQAVNDIKSKL